MANQRCILQVMLLYKPCNVVRHGYVVVVRVVSRVPMISKILKLHQKVARYQFEYTNVQLHKLDGLNPWQEL